MIDLLPERIRSKILMDGDTGCWLWQGCRVPDGYGQVRWDRRLTGIHRVTYTMLVRPIPPGYQVDHLCRVRECCNPAHLEAVTPAENSRRRDDRGHPNTAKTHCPAGHAYAGTNLYVRPDGRRDCRECHRGALRRFRSRKEST